MNFKEIKMCCGARRHTPVFPALWEAEAARLQASVSPGWETEQYSKTCLKIKNKKRAEDVVQYEGPRFNPQDTPAPPNKMCLG